MPSMRYISYAFSTCHSFSRRAAFIEPGQGNICIRPKVATCRLFTSSMGLGYQFTDSSGSPMVLAGQTASSAAL